VKVIVSSRFAVQVVDLETGERRDIPHQVNYPPFGISWNDDYLFLARRWYNRKGADIQVYDKDLGVIDSIMGGHPDMVNVHQIQWWDGALWVCCPAPPEGGNETVLIYRDGDIEAWYPFEGLGIKGVNSIFFRDDRVYLVAHNRGPSWVLQYSYPDLQLLWQGRAGTEAHNVAWWKDTFVVLDSGGSRVLVGCEALHEYTVSLIGYPRGLAISDTHIVIGQSYRIPDREERMQDKWGGLIIMNRWWELQQYINLKKGHVYDVRFLDVPDYAHHGQPWTGRHGE
jgi:hypothetical protein